MRITIIAALLAALVPAGALAQNEAGSDPMFVSGIPFFVEITANASAPPDGIDRAMTFGQQDGEVMLTGIANVPSTGQIPEGFTGEAVARVRYDMPRRAAQPLALDAAFVTTTGTPLFVLHEGRDLLWEIGLVEGVAMFREIEDDGVTGEWQSFDDPAGD